MTRHPLQAARFRFNFDGTAWWLITDPAELSDIDDTGHPTSLNRECTTYGCDEGIIRQMGRRDGQACTDCLNGRHLFTIEAQCPHIDSWGDPCEGAYEIAQSEWRPCPLCNGSKGHPGTVIHHVAVAAVLPVEADSPATTHARVIVRDDARQVLVTPGNRRLDMPRQFPTAAPGDTAVLLNVAETTAAPDRTGQ